MTETAGLTTHFNPAGGGQRSTNATDAARNLRATLSDCFKRALMTILEDGSAAKQGSYWVGSSGRKFTNSTIDALFDRCLLSIKFENRHRTRCTATLTDAGQYAAKEIQRERVAEICAENHRAPKVSEQASRFIAEVV